MICLQGAVGINLFKEIVMKILSAATAAKNSPAIAYRSTSPVGIFLSRTHLNK